MTEAIFVTKPSLAPLNEYVAYLEKIWASGVMTHNGPYLHQLERELSAYLKIPDLVCVSNGTVALQLAIRAFALKGEVITTPFSFIATSNIIAWEQCRPVFVDIDPDTWNIDPAGIAEKITKTTSAILPVHVFSNPCEVEKISQIADNNRLKVIYDAAHAMAVNINGKSILTYGDISCVSFHATKLFNTGEGGACFTNNVDLAEKVRRLRFFGFDSSKEVVDEGMNGKMTELAACLGLVNLKWLDKVREHRKKAYELYQKCLSGTHFVRFQKFNPQSYNYSYMPVVFDNETRALVVLKKLAEKNIFARRYFFPSLNTLEIYKKSSSLPNSEDIARRILCLPLYDDLVEGDIRRICEIVEDAKI